MFVGRVGSNSPIPKMSSESLSLLRRTGCWLRQKTWRTLELLTQTISCE